MTRVLSSLGQALLADMPPFYSNDVTTQTVVDTVARELQRVDDSATTITNHFFPQNADDTYGLLGVWENLLGLPVAPASVTLTQRRNKVLAHVLRRVAFSGLNWEAAVTEAIGSNSWTYAENTPSGYMIQITVPYQPGIGAPTGVTATPHTTGGTLPAGTRYYVVTAMNANGETLASTEVSATTTGTTGSVTIAWSQVTNATGYSVYESAVSRAETFLANAGSGLSYTDTGAVLADGHTHPPTTDTTAVFQAGQIMSLLRQVTPAHIGIDLAHGGGFIVGVSQVGDTAI